MSDTTLFIIGLLVTFLCLGGFLIHNIVSEKVAETDEETDT